jgi:hypothetical protein
MRDTRTDNPQYIKQYTLLLRVSARKEKTRNPHYTPAKIRGLGVRISSGTLSRYIFPKRKITRNDSPKFAKNTVHFIFATF